MKQKKKLPSKLTVGLELPIFIGEREECLGKLIRKARFWRELEPYVFKTSEKSETLNINAVKEAWVVEIVSDSPFDNGRELVRWITKFHSKGIIKIKDYFNEEEEIE